MARYRKIAIIEAEQWRGHGDHPDVTPITTNGADVCKECGNIMHLHGWCPTLEGGHIVCPSDWIATGTEGEHWPIKDRIFQQTYSLEV